MMWKWSNIMNRKNVASTVDSRRAAIYATQRAKQWDHFVLKNVRRVACATKAMVFSRCWVFVCQSYRHYANLNDISTERRWLVGWIPFRFPLVLTRINQRTQLKTMYSVVFCTLIFIKSSHLLFSIFIIRHLCFIIITIRVRLYDWNSMNTKTPKISDLLISYESTKQKNGALTYLRLYGTFWANKSNQRQR